MLTWHIGREVHKYATWGWGLVLLQSALILLAYDLIEGPPGASSLGQTLGAAAAIAGLGGLGIARKAAQEQVSAWWVPALGIVVGMGGGILLGSVPADRAGNFVTRFSFYSLWILGIGGGAGAVISLIAVLWSDEQVSARGSVVTFFVSALSVVNLALGGLILFQG